MMALLVVLSVLAVAVLWALFGRQVALGWGGGLLSALIIQVIARMIEVRRRRG